MYEYILFKESKIEVTAPKACVISTFQTRLSA